MLIHSTISQIEERRHQVLCTELDNLHDTARGELVEVWGCGSVGYAACFLFFVWVHKNVCD
jgi:hypothetical protein